MEIDMYVSFPFASGNIQIHLFILIHAIASFCSSIILVLLQEKSFY